MRAKKTLLKPGKFFQNRVETLHFSPTICVSICMLTYSRMHSIKLAREIASKSPVAALGTKKLLNYSRDHSVDDGLEFTAVWNSAMVQTNDVKAAMAAGMQKKKAKFEKL
jgi:hypothetical protein